MSSSTVIRYLGFIILSAIILSAPVAAQQTDPEVKSAIENVDKGMVEDVKATLPDLVAKYPNTPGILYLQGRLASDGMEAAKFYQSVVDNFPKSEYADDALFRIYQYYYSLGLYRTADIKMQQLKKDYSNSSYLTGKTEPTLPETEEAPVKLPSKEVAAPADTQLASVVETPVATEPEPPPATQSSEISPRTAPVQNGVYTLQVGAYSTSKNAQKQKSYFENLGYPVEVTNKIRSGRSLFLVWVGNFTTMQEARLFGREVKSKYKIDSIIVERY